MEGKIVRIRTIVDENELIRGYEIIIETIDCPKLMLGKCKIIQDETK